MGYKDISAGDKTAQATGARFIQSKNGTTGLEVAFKFTETVDGKPSDQRLSWVGWLSSGAIENTMKTLVEVLEFNGNDEVHSTSDVEARPALAGVLKDPKALNFGADVVIVIEFEEYEGKSRPKIKWVNKAGGSAFAGLTPETVKAELGAIGFKAQYLAAKKGAGQPTAKPEPEPEKTPEDDLPW